MKPRIRLHSRWWDSGWCYELWACYASDEAAVFGYSPLDAYKNWAKNHA